MEVHCQTAEHVLFGLTKELNSPTAPYILSYHSRKLPTGSRIDEDFDRYARCDAVLRQVAPVADAGFRVRG